MLGPAATGTENDAMGELVEYEQGTAFPGRIGRTIAESSPAWPRPLRAPAGAPNVVFLVLQPLPVGLVVGGQHAVPALEEGGLPRRLDRTRSSSAGRRASRRAAR